MNDIERLIEAAQMKYPALEIHRNPTHAAHGWVDLILGDIWVEIEYDTKLGFGVSVNVGDFVPLLFSPHDHFFASVDDALAFIIAALKNTA